MSHHDHHHSYKRTTSCAPLAKAGSEVVCVETIKHYYNTDGLKNLEGVAQNMKNAANAYDKAVTVADADKTLAEIAAVK